MMTWADLELDGWAGPEALPTVVHSERISQRSDHQVTGVSLLTHCVINSSKTRLKSTSISARCVIE